MDGKLVCEDCFHSEPNTIKTVIEKSCASCGTLLADVVKGGRLGCSSCYESFAETMPYIIASLQASDSGVRHYGRVPKTFLMEMAKSTSYEHIREEIIMRMNSASLGEKYLEASKMKNKLDELEKIKVSGALSDRLPTFIFEFWISLEPFH
jgi:protein arginine kinase activator